MKTTFSFFSRVMGHQPDPNPDSQLFDNNFSFIFIAMTGSMCGLVQGFIIMQCEIIAYFWCAVSSQAFSLPKKP